MLIEEVSGLDHLEALQNHSSQKIYEMSYAIVEKYFLGEVCSSNIVYLLYKCNNGLFYVLFRMILMGLTLKLCQIIRIRLSCSVLTIDKRNSQIFHQQKYCI